MVEVRTRASEAKGPFPGGKRVGSRGRKRKSVGVKARGKRVGSWGKKTNSKKKCKCEEGLIFFSRLIISGMLR